MTTKYDSDIVGWMTRGGKRVPIRKKKDGAAASSRRNGPMQLEDAKAFKDAGFDVASPQETADAFGRAVRTTDGKIIAPASSEPEKKEPESKAGRLVDTSVGDLGKFLRETDLDEITLRSSRVSGGWHDNEFAANQAGFSISRGHDDELKKKRQFSEVYRLKRKK